MRKRTDPAARRRGFCASIFCGLLSVSLTGCITPQEGDPVLERLDTMAATLAALESRVAEADLNEKSKSAEAELNLADMNAQLLALQDRMNQLPADLAELCPQSTPVITTQCDNTPPVQTVVMAGDKLVVGEVERVWIDPPQAQMVARIDTGASSSSLHADNVVEFERDGDDWVRFDINLDGEMVTLERDIVRHVRVYQQADPEGTRRPVVTLRVRLGDLNQRVEFTLADRSHLDFEMILGRNFLTDVALVDVGKQYVQPPLKTDDKQ